MLPLYCKLKLLSLLNIFFTVNITIVIIYYNNNISYFVWHFYFVLLLLLLFYLLYKFTILIFMAVCDCKYFINVLNMLITACSRHLPSCTLLIFFSINPAASIWITLKDGVAICRGRMKGVNEVTNSGEVRQMDPHACQDIQNIFSQNGRVLQPQIYTVPAFRLPQVWTTAT